MDTEQIISPQAAERAGARLNRVLTSSDYNPRTGQWEAVALGYLTLPAKPIASGGDGKVRGKRTHGYARAHESQNTAAQLAENELRRDYVRCLPSGKPSAPAPSAPSNPPLLAG